VTYPRARKRFGQHFLEPAWVAKLVASIDPHDQEAFLEIGPGRGALTRALAPHVARLVGVEIDRDLAAALASSAPPNVEIVADDFLAVDVVRIAKQAGPLPVRVVGNLPYNVSSPIVFRLLSAADEGRVLADATLMLQREVADRLVAQPGSKAYGTLAVQVSRLADVTTVLTLPPGAFRPPPKVTSAVVHLAFRPSTVDVGDSAIFERVVRGAFLMRRKTILNALTPVADSLGRNAADLLRGADVDPRLRPEDLTAAAFARISSQVGLQGGRDSD
jgi:16S rRNA (adenine1518-N6/adenine1519-N6)-dimethyltransferase